MSRILKSDQLKPSPLSRRLVRRLREAGFALSRDDNDYALQGLAPGYDQKAAGAWAWQLFVNDRNGQGWRPMCIGSSDRASSLRRWSKVDCYSIGSDVEVTIDNSENRNGNP